MVIRNSGIKGPFQFTQADAASGIFDTFDAYMAKKGDIWPFGGALYNFTSFTFTNPVREPWGPTSSEVTSQSAYSSSAFASDTDLFRVIEGVQYWKVPQSGNYTITAKGPAGGSHVSSLYHGSGGILRATFLLQANTIIAMLVGSRPPVTAHYSSYRWQGGAGGTFVAVVPDWGSNTSNLTYPLVVAGGGSGNRSNNSSHRTNASANMSPDGKDGNGSNGGDQGAGASPGGHNYTGGGGGAGWNGVQNSHSDCRNLYSFGGNYPSNTSTCSLNRPGARGFNTTASTLIGGGGVGTGGIIQYSHANSGSNIYKGSGGYGGGGPGGWGGQGGAGGYSGGGNGNNSSSEYGGGGGSFINSGAITTSVAAATIGTSTGSWNSGSGAFSGHSILATASSLTNLGYNSGDGAVTIERGLI